jgi:hypothetical protein
MKFIQQVFFFLLLTFFIVKNGSAQKMKLGLLVYNGGGDWYANPTALKNLANFANRNLGTNFIASEEQIEVSSSEIFSCPIIFATGHGRISFSSSEAQNLRTYLIGGGFLHIDDNYGMDKYVKEAMKQVFPDIDMVELPFNHPIYHQKFNFNNGLPKIHQHDGKSPRGFGWMYKGRLVCFYSTETDLNDGWEDPEVHKDPEEKRQQALQMGANIIQYVFMGK